MRAVQATAMIAATAALLALAGPAGAGELSCPGGQRCVVKRWEREVSVRCSGPGASVRCNVDQSGVLWLCSGSYARGRQVFSISQPSPTDPDLLRDLMLPCPQGWQEVPKP